MRIERTFYQVDVAGSRLCGDLKRAHGSVPESVQRAVDKFAKLNNRKLSAEELAAIIEKHWSAPPEKMRAVLGQARALPASHSVARSPFLTQLAAIMTRATEQKGQSRALARAMVRVPDADVLEPRIRTFKSRESHDTDISRYLEPAGKEVPLGELLSKLSSDPPGHPRSRPLDGAAEEKWVLERIRDHAPLIAAYVTDEALLRAIYDPEPPAPLDEETRQDVADALHSLSSEVESDVADAAEFLIALAPLGGAIAVTATLKAIEENRIHPRLAGRLIDSTGVAGLPALVECLTRGPFPGIALNRLRDLGALARSTVPALIQFLGTTEDSGKRKLAAQALVVIAPQAVREAEGGLRALSDALARCKDDPDIRAAVEVINLCGAVGAAAFPALSYAATHLKGPHVSQEIARALQACGPGLKDHLPEVLSTMGALDAYIDPSICETTLKLIGRPHEKDVPALVEMITNPATAKHAMQALVPWAERVPVEPLMRWLSDIETGAVHRSWAEPVLMLLRQRDDASPDVVQRVADFAERVPSAFQSSITALRWLTGFVSR